MRRVVLILVVGCGLFLGCAGTEVATQNASRPERTERPDYPAERVLIVLDASASMGQQGADAMLQSTQAILDSLSLADKFSLAMTSRGQVFLYKPGYEPVTNEKVDAALQWAAKQPTGGGTDLAGATQAVLSLRGETEGRANLILLTDGQNNIDLDQLLVKPSQLEGLTVWGVTPAVFRDPEIEALCLRTGGSWYRSIFGSRVAGLSSIRWDIAAGRRRPQNVAHPSEKGKPRIADSRDALFTEMETQKRVEERLAQKVSIDFKEKELPEALEHLREIGGLSLYVVWGAMECDSPDIRTAQVTLQLKDVSLAKALELTLEDAGGGLMEWDYMIEGGVIHIASRETLSARLASRVYNFRDLLYQQTDPAVPMAEVAKESNSGDPVALRFARTWGPTPDCSVNPRLSGADANAFFAGVSSQIQQSIDEESWCPNGCATLSQMDGMFAISQTYWNHQAIREFLAHLRYMRKQPAPPDAESKTSNRVEQKLRRDRASVRLVEQEFPAVMQYFREVSGLNVYVNWGAMENDNPDIRTAQITVDLKMVSLKKFLEVVLDDAGGGLMKLGYVIEGGVIRIDTWERLNENIVIRMYNVRDLLHKQPLFPISTSMRQVDDSVIAMSLLELIKRTISNDSWCPNGRAALSITDGVLVILQTQEGHQKVRELLGRLRAARNLPTSQAAYRSSESVYTLDGQLAPWAKQLLQAVADGTLSPHSTVVRSKRDGAEYITLDGVKLRVPKP